MSSQNLILSPGLKFSTRSLLSQEKSQLLNIITQNRIFDDEADNQCNINEFYDKLVECATIEEFISN